MLTVLVPVLCRLDIICARCVLCGRAASVRPPHRQPRGSIRAAEAGRWLAAQQVWHRDGALWHRFSSSLTAVCGTGQYRCRSVSTSQRPSLPLLGLRPYGGSVRGWGGCQRVFLALSWVPQSTCFGALVTSRLACLAIVFSGLLALVPLSTLLWWRLGARSGGDRVELLPDEQWVVSTTCEWTMYALCDIGFYHVRSSHVIVLHARCRFAPPRPQNRPLWSSATLPGCPGRPLLPW